MPLYKYSAVNKSGEIIEGTYSTEDKSTLLKMIREKEYLPVRIEELLERRDTIAFASMRKVKLKDLAVFCRQFYTMLHVGVTIIKCLDILQQQTENKRLRAVAKDVYETVQKGMSLSDALRNHRDVFPDLMIHMVEAGEASGSLDNIMNRIAAHFEKENKLRSKISTTMIYPVVLSVIATLVVIFLMVFVMPSFIGMFTASGIELPLPTRILLSISNFMRGFWYIIIPLLLAIAYAAAKFLKSDKGSLAWDRFKLWMPVVKGTVRKIATARFARTLSTLLSSGMPILYAMEITSRVLGNKVAAEAVLRAREDMRRGMDLATPIKRTGFFPPMVESMIRIGEESGTLDEILDRTATYFDDEVEIALQKMVALLEPVMIVIMAIIIGFIVISMALPMFEMIQTIQ